MMTKMMFAAGAILLMSTTVLARIEKPRDLEKEKTRTVQPRPAETTATGNANTRAQSVAAKLNEIGQQDPAKCDGTCQVQLQAVQEGLNKPGVSAETKVKLQQIAVQTGREVKDGSQIGTSIGENVKKARLTEKEKEEVCN